MDLPRFVAALACACALARAHAECAPVEILDPAKNSTIHGARPDIRWGGLPGVKVYRVQIESRVPEGQVIERIDTRVGDTRFGGGAVVRLSEPSVSARRIASPATCSPS
jgi:hypothetical protein